MIVEVFIYFLFMSVLIVVVTDILPIMNNWIGRIHIGRYNDELLWNNSITNRATSWLLKTPKIKVTDNSRLIIIDMFKGNYTKSTIQHWQKASLLLGLIEYLKTNRDKEIENQINIFLEKHFNQKGQWIEKPKHIDSAILAYAIMKLDFIDIDKYKSALDYIWELINDHIGNDGTVEYRKFMENYRYIDTIGFICPFLSTYGIKYNKEDCINLALKQIEEYEKYGMLKDNGIPCHVYDINSKVPLGLFGWGRGLGWFAIGLIDTWNELKGSKKYNVKLEDSIKNFAKVVIKYQQPNGGWNWTVTRSECRTDSSSTATLGWFLLNAAQLKGVSSDCLESSDKAIRYLMGVTRKSGSVDFSQGDTKDIGVYSSSFNILPFTQGFCIRSINLRVLSELQSKRVS
ncbi:glycoside hydrolase family 88 protein [Pseudalkalibacillus caeni]|uniref:Unsaturated rhamnogalacturonyl hydrolase n=1 Tax=Exobacillus caeni TaxID=2574798 RepID=A0A5R9EXF4_9BACL|nr:glycoside hydrolase family 88 protein [Pseudalkalibacillus caeni]TLS35767.1 hypothetical protein FCL54_18295 [Pseudalkalibacillus caeni]